MIAGPTVDRHHLVPRSQGGKEAVFLHLVCHKKIHSVLSERELAKLFSTFEALRGHPEIERFVRWIQKKDPEFVTRHRPHGKRGRR